MDCFYFPGNGPGHAQIARPAMIFTRYYQTIAHFNRRRNILSEQLILYILYTGRIFQ